MKSQRIVHLASGWHMAELQAAKDDGLPLTVETCRTLALLRGRRAGVEPLFAPRRCTAEEERLWAALSED
jgi:hypothetical protein